MAQWGAPKRCLEGEVPRECNCAVFLGGVRAAAGRRLLPPREPALPPFFAVWFSSAALWSFFLVRCLGGSRVGPGSALWPRGSGPPEPLALNPLLASFTCVLGAARGSVAAFVAVRVGIATLPLSCGNHCPACFLSASGRSAGRPVSIWVFRRLVVLWG